MAVVDPHARQISLFQKLSDRLTDWRETRARDAQLAALPAGELKRLSRDAGFNSPRQMLAVNARGFQAAGEMTEMAVQLGVDITAVRADHPEVVRQMEIACCCCDRKATCDKALASGAAAKIFDEFCPNTTEFKSFISET